MRSYVRALLALVLAACLMLVAGCSSTPTVATSTAAPAAATEAPAAATEAPAAATEAPPEATKAPLNDDTTVSKIKVDDKGWTSVSCGNDYVMALQADGTLCGWGRNTYGQVGSATYKEPNVLAIQPVLSGIVAIDTGDSHTCAIDDEGVMYIWGSNHSGRLGDGTTAGRTAPTINSTLVSTGEKIIDIAPGMNCTFAVAEDGTLYGVGSNSKGQLGLTTGEKEIWTPVAVLEGVSRAYSNGEFSFAIKTDGTIWATGENKRGQLGTGDEEDIETWTQITTISDVKMFALGEEFSLALKNDGTVWATGRNNRGQLGIGSEESSIHTWTQLTGVDSVSYVIAGVETSGMIKEDGTLWLWGMNKYGQVGDDSTENRSVPVQILTDVTVADIGDSHAAALKSDGTIWIWGYNKYSQLCDGTTADSHTPKQLITANTEG